MVSKVTICFNPIHNSFKDQPPLNIEPIDESKPALKIIRAALRAMEIDPESSDDYELRRCRCNGEGIVAEEDLVARRLKVQDMKWNEVERLFLRKVQVEEIEIEQDEELKIKEDDDFKVKMEDSDEEISFKFEDSEREDDDDDKSWAIKDDEEEDEKDEAEGGDYTPKAPEPTVSELRSDISASLGGDQWQAQLADRFESIDMQVQILQHLKTALLRSRQIPGYLQETMGLANVDFVEALHRVYLNRLNVGDSPVFLRRKPPALKCKDFTKTIDLLRQKLTTDLSWDQIQPLPEPQIPFAELAEMFPLADSGLSQSRLRLARIISFLWQNDQWIFQLQSFPEFSSAISSANSSEFLHRLSRIAVLTQVKGNDLPEGVPPIALEAFEETLRLLRTQQVPSTPVRLLQRIFRTLHQANPETKIKKAVKRAKKIAAKKALLEAAIEIPQELRVTEEELEEGEIRESNGEGSHGQVSSQTERIQLDPINQISKLLGGSKWQDQLIGKQKLVDLSNKDCLDRLLQLIERYVQYPGSIHASSGLCNSDILEAISRVHANRTNHPAQWITKWNQLSTFQPSDYKNAISFLQKKIKNNSSWKDFPSPPDPIPFLELAEEYPLLDSGLSSMHLIAARIISFCWQNVDWISPSTPVPGFSSFTMEFPESEIFILAQVAAHSKVKAGSPPGNGFPASVLEALRLEQLNLVASGREDCASLLSKVLERFKIKKRKPREQDERQDQKKAKVKAS